ncbi:DUF7344 domain-containing protein [Halohasta litorea]|uniref:ArsR family transcriptional regulator n=1 Tax=Halohasta litorea TaxID=869891 RepID=A0ABD6D4Z2_9EURY|nr:ArsR family transcriptional regulator [Halohasta litorea]MEA1930179.1 ArsR family transcriptional regulator [Euryarchaeota archaeon]
MASQTRSGLDETFDVLTHPYRRYVLYYLRTQAEAVDITTLSAMLANELEGPSATAGEKTPKDIEIALHHIHLPKLADVGLITFAHDERAIELDEITGHSQFIDQAARVDGYAPPAAGD